MKLIIIFIVWSLSLGGCSSNSANALKGDQAQPRPRAKIPQTAQECAEKGSGFEWENDLCIKKSARNLSDREQCESKQGYIYEDSICKPIVAVDKLCQGEVQDGVCIGEQSQQIAQKNQAAQEKAQKVAEERIAQAEAELARQSMLGDLFKSLCLDEKADPAVRSSILAILKQLNETDCQRAHHKLSALGQLTLQAEGISSLQPLMGFLNLKSIVLKGVVAVDRSEEHCPKGYDISPGVRQFCE